MALLRVMVVAFHVARKAAELCRADAARTTYDALIWMQGFDAAASPDLLFSHIDRLPAGQLAKLVRQINDWLVSQGSLGDPPRARGQDR